MNRLDKHIDHWIKNRNGGSMPLRYIAGAIALGLLCHGQVMAATVASNQNTPAEDDIEKMTVHAKSTDVATPTRMPLTIKEIPQSISAISAELMAAASMTDINDVMMNVPGVNVSLYDSQRPLYFARGFQITDFQVDGIPTYSGSTNQEYDTALYDRVEVIRGANGLFTGPGAPSATVNLIRKRPGKEFALNLTGRIGSWNLRRAELDVSSPLNADGTVRSRLVVAAQDADSFRDRYTEDKTAALAIVEADLTADTTAAFGLQLQDNNPTGTIWGTIPLYHADGSLADFPVSSSFAPNWTKWQRESNTFFADLKHRLNERWQLTAALNRTQGEVESLRVYATGFADPNSGKGLTLLAGVGAGEDIRTGLDLYLTGSYSAFELEHDLIVGANIAKTESDTLLMSSVAGWSYQVPDARAYDGTAPKPVYRKTGANRLATTKQHGVYAVNRVRLTEGWSLITGARLSSWQTGTDNFNTSGIYVNTTGSYEVNNEVTPYAGLVYELNADYSLYASYTDIFNPQNYKDKDNNLLAPLVGSNAEIGIKAQLLDQQLFATVALFKTRQDNFAVRDMSQPENSLPDGSSAYLAVNGTESQGVELSLSGKLADQLLLNAGYSYVDTSRPANERIWTNLPKHTLQLTGHYDVSELLTGVTLGAGINWQSETVGYGVTHPVLKQGATFRQSSYTLLNLFASWQINGQLQSRLSISNALDKLYWANIDYANYGEPRNITLSLSWQY